MGMQRLHLAARSQCVSSHIARAAPLYRCYNSFRFTLASADPPSPHSHHHTADVDARTRSTLARSHALCVRYSNVYSGINSDARIANEAKRISPRRLGRVGRTFACTLPILRHQGYIKTAMLHNGALSGQPRRWPGPTITPIRRARASEAGDARRSERTEPEPKSN